MSLILKITGIVGISLFTLFLLKPSVLYRKKEADVDTQKEIQKAEIKSEAPLATTTEPVEKKPDVSKSIPKTENRAPVVTEKIILPPAPPPAAPLPAPKSAVVPVSPPAPVASSSPQIPPPAPVPPPPPAMPPLEEAALLRAVVKIECPTADGLGKYIGSGFAISGDRVVTAAHVIKDSGGTECRVIFPRERRPVHYLKGTIQDFSAVAKRHDEEGIDVAVIQLPRLEEYDDARAIFGKEYPRVPYQICENPVMIGDRLLHFGYPSSFLDQAYLQESKGEAVFYGDINGIKDQTSADGSSTFKSPIFEYTKDETAMHAYMISRVPTFYGDSGGLAFNVAKQCILGPHRGGTIGGGSGENYSVFPLLGWGAIKSLIGN